MESLQKTLKHIKRIMATIVGVTVVLIGLALFVLPGPGFLVLIIGIAILATEYEFARVWLRKAKEKYEQGKSLVIKNKKKMNEKRSSTRS